jgi:hypothetical protein
MISRELANCLHVHAFEGESSAETLMPFHSCGEQAGFTCSAYGVLSTAALQSNGVTSGEYGARGGRIIDRLAFRQNYNSVALLVDAWGLVLASSTVATSRYMGVSVGLQDSSSTCSADFAAYSTANWLGRRPLTLQTQTTTTCSPWYDCTGEAQAISQYQGGQLTTGTTTSSGYAVFVNAPIPVLPLTGAKRFIRMLVAPTHLADGTNSVMPMHVVGSLLFGDPDKGQPTCSERGRAFVTSGTST